MKYIKALGLGLSFSLGIMVSGAFAAEQVPFGDVISEKVYNYHRHTPYIATSGKLAEGAIKELKSQRFKTILDLRTKAEGVDEEAAAAKSAGLNYYNVPVSKRWPEPETFATFKRLIEDEDNYPILVHCASANRVGMMWTVYQLNSGVDYQTAIMAGRTIGMKPSLEKSVAAHFKPASVMSGE